MNTYYLLKRAFAVSALVVCVALLFCVGVSAQEVSGDLGAGAGIFRPKNPETTSKRRTPNRPRPTPNANPRPTHTVNPAEVEERFEDALDEGNEARDGRKFLDAERAYRGAQTIKPGDWRAAYGLGNIYTDQQRWDEAERAYRQAVTLNSSKAEVHIALSFVLIQPRTGNSNNARLLADAETSARRAIQLQPANAIPYDRLGAALEARGITDNNTEQAYRRAIELDQQFAVAYVHLARLLRKMNRVQEAEPLYHRAEELAHDAPTLVLIAEALQSEQRWDDTEPLLKRAIEMDARNPSALYFLGRMLVVRKRYEEAEPILKRAIEVSPHSFAPYYVLGSAYLRQERFDDAERTDLRVAEFATGNNRKLLAGAYGLEGVGDGYMRAGRRADALRVYLRAQQLDPTSTSLQAKIASAR
ncbi:MAG: hypothetical protein AUG51_02250 [Acidobacteria bacterium 13_1_20CM_3_53_8]|nr:MAG: hypothetical protein AUG51_02250 [Acidobacteria bacterium 13_1_20CM_3_53_8]